MAQARNEHPLALAQHVYFVGGRAGYAATYLIAQANMSGRFVGPITWEMAGAGKDLAVTASATLKATGQIVSCSASMAMATAEGWAKNAKYQTMPQQMLSYRSATMLIRLYAPEVIMAGGGLPPVEEIEPLSGAAVVPPTKAEAARKAGLVVDVQPEPAPSPDVEAMRLRCVDALQAVYAPEEAAYGAIGKEIADAAKAGDVQALRGVLGAINKLANQE
jgi:hypothetical protein